jgi:hypothetical protein
MLLSSSAWGQEKRNLPQPEGRQQPHTTPHESSDCYEYQEWSSFWRACMRQNIPCFALHGKALMECCKVNEDSEACKGQ